MLIVNSMEHLAYDRKLQGSRDRNELTKRTSGLYGKNHLPTFAADSIWVYLHSNEREDGRLTVEQPRSTYSIAR